MTDSKHPGRIDPNSGEPITEQDINDTQPAATVSENEKQPIDPEAELEAPSEREDGTNLG